MVIATIIVILLFAYMIRHANQNPSYEEMGYDMDAGPGTGFPYIGWGCSEFKEIDETSN